MRNSRAASHTSFWMRRMIFLILLLAQWAESSHSELMRQQTNSEEMTRHVLIRSKRRWVLSTLELDEENPGPFPQIFTQLYNDKHVNHSLYFELSGQGVTKEPVGVFSIHKRTGRIYIHKPIDRETYPSLQVEFNVQDAVTGEVLDKTLAFNVVIKDKNDNPPVFEPRVLYAKLPENINEVSPLPFSLQASDNDEEDNDNSRISMKIVSQYPAWPKFSLKPIAIVKNTMISTLSFTGCFDYDKEKTYKILVEARDHGYPPLSSTGTVNIAITDTNTHAPVFDASMLNAQAMEMESNKEILRIPVQDKDTPNTPASRAVFTILKGNEEGNYKIETDPVTNEGVLSVIKGKDYERTTLTELEIGVENEEPLFVCIDGKPVSPVPETLQANGRVKVAVKVIDVNDPPVFQNKIQKVYKVEEEEPGEVLFTPTIKDEDSDPSKVRYELVEDPAKWMSIDPKTGKITLVKKMDRESPHVHNSTYTVVMRAIDDGEPPATGTGTLVVHLGDKNDNKPHLTSNISVMCGNKADRVRVTAEDADDFPYSGPFTFTLGNDDQELKNLWMLEQSTGSEILLISLKTLPYGNYSVPLKIADQQGVEAHDVLKVVLCDCRKGDVCLDLLPRSSTLHGAAIGILLGSLLFMALLLCLCFVCKCKDKKNFQPCLQDGNQTLIPYNEEGAPVFKSDLLFIQSQGGSYRGLKAEMMQFDPQFQQSIANHFGNLKMGTIQHPNEVSDTIDSRNIYGNSTTWTRNRNSIYDTKRNRFNRYASLQSERNVEELLKKKLYQLSKEQQDFPGYQPHDYRSEGSNTSAASLDKLSFHATGDDLDFLQNLGPKFCTLGEISQQEIKKKNMKV